MAETPFLDRTRDGYDRTAAGYVAAFGHHLDDKPLDLAMLRAFTDMVAPHQRVVDIGCGTGVATAILRDNGARACGIDLSPNMIAHARRLHPDIEFTVGSMTDLKLPDASVGGVCAWYSVIHIPDEHLPTVFAEFHRVLTPGGVALLAFQVGDRPRHLTEAFGEPVDLLFHRRHPDTVAHLLHQAGLPVHARLVRAPEGDGVESTPQGYLIARKPASAGEEHTP
ncbi:class I SAM-dependent methyltransferase [Mycobacterium adipatum]|uniref:class I SAM-dependent DNA methyltransferase n=1 Tax=Mycobacterium adipatum TaxID=1682113 RepID=UPI0034E0DD4A